MKADQPGGSGKRGLVSVLSRMLPRIRTSVTRSLQCRVIFSIAVVTLVVAAGFSTASFVSVRSSLMEQATSQAQKDFADEMDRAQANLDSADLSNDSDAQRLISDLASSLQDDGSSNLLGIYIVGEGEGGADLIPVSTDPNYLSLVSESMRRQVLQSSAGEMFYQPVGFDNEDRHDLPGAILGGLLSRPDGGSLSLFAAYSYEIQQTTVTNIEFALLVSCLLMSIVVGVIIWRVMRGIVKPVRNVASTAEKLASGDLSARAEVTRRDEIGVLQQSFNAMADSLNEKIDELETVSSMQRRFVSDVSHELRTPVTTIRMASDLLEARKDGFEPSTARTVELLSEQTSRFQQMLADLLEISRYDAGSASADLVETDIRIPIGDAVDDVREIAQARQVVLAVTMPDYPIAADMDSRRITRIIRNLLGNAIDFAEDKPVEVRLAANGRAVTVSVRDFGVGIDPENLEHIFDRFWRADTSRSRLTGGTGLGLSIAMQDTMLHHGDLTVRSCLGEGTWFLLTIPVRANDDRRLAPEDHPVRFIESSYPAVVGDFLEGRTKLDGYVDGAADDAEESADAETDETETAGTGTDVAGTDAADTGADVAGLMKDGDGR
ncbi:MtrAB system histidine kinase MtrB [Bifidobacterium simiarum]|nr:MtrAB system histidine kinase MtrB [Bifidobacterium simiarum]